MLLKPVYWFVHFPSLAVISVYFVITLLFKTLGSVILVFFFQQGYIKCMNRKLKEHFFQKINFCNNAKV